ncbi:MAG TPA: hypothetical protein PKZ76_09600 [Xanthomonadaceae bacterium]|nr:hypothetical protein [Xanthomonadaceae bacterium]
MSPRLVQGLQEPRDLYRVFRDDELDGWVAWQSIKRQRWIEIGAAHPVAAIWTQDLFVENDIQLSAKRRLALCINDCWSVLQPGPNFLGRYAQPGEVVISQRLAQLLYGGPREALGRPLHASGTTGVKMSLVVGGVLPPDFLGTDFAEEIDIWVEWSEWPELVAPMAAGEGFAQDFITPRSVVARASSPADRTAVSTVISQDLVADRNLDTPVAVKLTRHLGGSPRLAEQRDQRIMLLSYMGIALLALGFSFVVRDRLHELDCRSSEIAIRSALGSSRYHSMVMLTNESFRRHVTAFVLASAILVAALLASSEWSNEALGSFAFTTVGAGLLGGALFVLLSTGTLFAIDFAWLERYRRSSSNAMNAAVRRSGALDRAAAVLSCSAACIALLLCGGALDRVAKLTTVDHGFKNLQVLELMIVPPDATMGVGRIQDQREALVLSSLLQSEVGDPVAYATSGPFGGAIGEVRVRSTSHAPILGEPPRIGFNAVDPSYFSLLGLDVSGEQAWRHVGASGAWANMAAAQALGLDPGETGQTLHVEHAFTGESGPLRVERWIPNAQFRAPMGSAVPTIYVRVSKLRDVNVVLVGSTSAPQEAVRSRVERIVQTLLPNFRVINRGLFESQVIDAMQTDRVQASWAIFLAAIALVLGLCMGAVDVLRAIARSARSLAIRFCLGARVSTLLAEWAVRSLVFWTLVAVLSVIAWRYLQGEVEWIALLEWKGALGWIGLGLACLYVIEFAATWTKLTKLQRTDLARRLGV